MLNNPYEAPQELATGGYITKELHSVTVHFDDIHYSLSSGQLNGGYHHRSIHQFILVQRFLRLLQ